MDSLLSVPSPSSPSASPGGAKGSKGGRPLSSHGMPKEPLPSPGRPHRFSDASKSPPLLSPTLPMSPMSATSAMSPPPMSPPMSAKSFSTIIDSEPSTPAYSPRMGSNWDGSTLVLLSPVPIGSKSPKEPVWEMMAPPVPKPKKKTNITKTTPFPLLKEITSSTSLSSHPFKKREEETQKENVSPAEGEVGDDAKAKEESSSSTAPLSKLATRMKHMLRRKSAGDPSEKQKKNEKRKREYEDVDRIEDLHWTEM